MISVVQDYGRERVAVEQWTPEAWSAFKEILRRLEALDAKLGQPGCEDPAKAAWMAEAESRLAALEHGA